MNRRLLTGLCVAGLLASSTAAKSLNWASRTPLPVGLVGHGAVDVGGTLFVIGGGNADTTVLSASVFAYSRATDTWTQKASLPGPRSYFGAAAIGNTIYVMGGAVPGSSTVSCLGYNTTTNTWFPVAPMPGPVQTAGCAATPTNVFVMGGITQPGAVYQNTNYQYNPGPDSWVIRPAVPAPARVGPVAAYAQGKIYLVGGYGGGVLANVEEYDPASPGWAVRNPIPRGHSEATVAVVSGTVYIMGGSVSAGPTNAVDVLDAPRDISWQGPGMVSARNGGAAAFHQGVIQVMGGYSTYPTPDPFNEAGWLGIEAAGAASPASVAVPQSFQVSLTVSHSGWANANGITPKIQINTSALSVTLFAGPTPPGPVTIGPGAVQTFVWTFSTVGAGTVSITVTAMGTDSVTGLAMLERAVVSVAVATPPQPPVMITARGGTSLVNLAWLPAIAGSNAVSGYRIYRTTSTAVAYGQIAGTIGAFATSYVDTTITNGRPYLYKVEAFDSSVPPITGGLSGVLTATPFLPSGPPSNLTLKVMSAKLTLYWSIGAIGSNGLNSFDIWRRTTPGTDTLIAPSYSAGNTYYNDTGIINGTTYTYWMQQRDVLGNPSATSMSTADAPRSGPFAPSTVTAMPGNNQVVLGWSGGSAGTFSPLSGYSVYRGPSSGAETFYAGPVYTDGYADLGAVNGSNYYYVIRSRDALGHESSNSTELLLGASNGMVNPPSGVTAVPSAAGVRVSWGPAAPGDTSIVGAPNQYAVMRSTCAVCPPSSSQYVSGGTTVWNDPAAVLGGGGVFTYRVRTRSANAFESGDGNGITISPAVSFPFKAALSISPAAPVAGGTVTVSITLTNTGGMMHQVDQLDLGAFQGGGLIAGLTGPGPTPPNPVPAGMGQTYTWTFQGAGGGPIGITVTMTGFDQSTVAPTWTVVSTTLFITTAPPAQPVISAAVGGPGIVNLAWPAATAGTYPISGYRVYRTTATEVAPVQIGTAVLAATTYADVTVVNGTPYLYRVEAFDTSVPPVTGPVSSYESATPFVAPGVPTGFTMRAWNSTILLTWLPGTAGTYPLANFNVWMKVGAGSFSIASGPAASATYWAFATATNGTAYSTYLTAVDTLGHVSGSTFTATEFPHAGPYAPVTCTAAAGNQRVMLSWSAGTSGTFALSGYSVYRGLSPGAETFYAGPLFAQVYTDTSVVNGTAYSYVIRSRDDLSNESANSTERTVTPSAATANPPSGVTALATASGVVVSWSPAATGDPGTIGTPTEYVIVRSTCAACGGSSSHYVASTSSVWVDTDPLVGGLSYSWSVRTRTSLGVESGDVAGVNVSPPLAFALAAALSVTPGAPSTGGLVTLVVTVTNTGGSNIDVQSLALGLYRGAGLVGAPTGPTPAPAVVASGASAAFTWTIVAAAPGPVGFSVTVTAVDQGTTQPGWLVLAAAVTITTPQVEPPVSTDPVVRLLSVVKAGGMVAGPNAFSHGAGAVIRIAMRGDPGGRPRVRIFDEAGREVRVLDVTLDGRGTTVVSYDAADAGGRPLAPGAYFIVADGGGVRDRRMIVVRGGPR